MTGHWRKLVPSPWAANFWKKISSHKIHLFGSVEGGGGGGGESIEYIPWKIILPEKKHSHLNANSHPKSNIEGGVGVGVVSLCVLFFSYLLNQLEQTNSIAHINILRVYCTLACHPLCLTKHAIHASTPPMSPRLTIKPGYFPNVLKELAST